jgi:hypothetical protein
MDGQEAYGAVAGEMYVPGETDYRTPDEVFVDLDPEIVANAKRYAEANNLPWPPIASGAIGWVTF